MNILTHRPSAHSLRVLLAGFAVLSVLTAIAPWLASPAGAAEELITTCIAETQTGLQGWFASSQSACSVPSGYTITRAVLSVVLDDGGEVFINNGQIFSVANDPGVHTETRNVNSGLSAGQQFTLRVEARNAIDGEGNGLGAVYGKATLQVYGDRPTPPVAPTADIKVNGSDGPVTVQRGSSATATWTSTNATSCTVSPTGWTGTSGSRTEVVNAGITLNLRCTGPGGEATDSVTVNVTDPPPAQLSCSASPSSVNINQNVTFTASGGTGSFSWSGGGNPSTGSGTNFVTQFSTAGTKTATVTSGSQSAQCSVTVNQPPAQNAQLTVLKEFQSGSSGNPSDFTFTVGGQTVGHNQTVTLQAGSYQVAENARSGYELVNFRGACDGNGNVTLSAGQNATCIATNRQVHAAVTADIKANGQDGPITIPSNTAATISWTSTGATSCTVTPTGWTGTSGSQSTGNLAGSQTYTLNCTGPGGSASDSVTVNVSAAAVSCSPSAQNVAINQLATITASGGTGTFSWSAPSGNPASGSGSSFSTQYGASGTFTVTVTSGSQNAQCSVVVAQPNAPTADIKANGQDGTVNIAFNTSANITWTSTNATSCTVTPTGWTGTSGSQSTGNLTSNQTYILTCTGPGGTATDSVTVNVSGAGLTCSPSSQNVSVNQPATFTATGGTGTFIWSAATGNPGTGTGSSFSTQFPIAGTFAVAVSSGGQTAQCFAVVGGAAGPTVTLTANPSTINQGQSSVLVWSSTNATSCFASGGSWTGSKTLSGSETVFPQFTQTYSISCTGPGGTATAQATVFVNVTGQQPTVNLFANPTSITQGQSSVLTWNSQNTTSCFASGGNWTGTKAVNGSETVFPQLTTTYTITCTGPNGAASDSETVFVNVGGGATNLQVTKSVLNRTLNQTFFSNSAEAQGLDVLEFEIKVRNVDTRSGNVTVRDILPSQLFYVPGSTTVDGGSVGDGITTGGIQLGNMFPQQEKTVRFRAVVFAGTTPQFLTNQANATMDGGVQNAFASIQIRNRGQVLGAADIVTGADDLLPWILFLGLVGSALSYWTVFKKRWIKLQTASSSGPVSDLDRLVQELRKQEQKPDTDRLTR